MMDFPSRPEVVRCYFENTVQPHIPAMCLRWDPDAPGVADRTWHLPGGVSVKGPAPEHFGVTIHRHGANSYHVRVLWNQLIMDWNNLTRVQIMTSSLALLLRVLGTDLWYLLDQPASLDAIQTANVA